MNGINVVGDPNNTKSCSSEIIISNLNDGLKQCGLYDEHGRTVVYDCLAQTYNYDTNHIICAYETSIPTFVKVNAGGRNLIGVSSQNQSFFINGGYPKDKTHHFLLGVDSKLWHPTARPANSKFRFGMMCDSNTRAAYSELIAAFGSAFGGKEDVELYIKDRWATDEFKKMVKVMAEYYKITVIHDDTHVVDKPTEVAIYNQLDCHVFVNRTSTFALTVAQGMAMQLPTIVMDYSGPRDYCNLLNSCLIDYRMNDITDIVLLNLIQQGYRNYLVSNSGYFSNQPQWAQPSITSLKDNLLRVYLDKEYRDRIALNGRAMAESLTWSRAALNLAWIVNQ